MIELILCADHKLYLEPLALHLAANGVRVTNAVFEIDEALKAVAKTKVDICLLVAPAPDTKTRGDVVRILEADPAIRIMLLVGACDQGRANLAERAGVACIALKTDTTQRVLEILGSIIDGHPTMRQFSYRPPPIDQLADNRQWQTSPARFLTPRERSVLGMLVDGKSTGRIASEMGVCYSTVRTYIHSILTKLGVHSRTEAVAFAVRRSLVEVGSPDDR